jgi:hypothetical protein
MNVETLETLAPGMSQAGKIGKLAEGAEHFSGLTQQLVEPSSGSHNSQERASTPHKVGTIEKFDAAIVREIYQNPNGSETMVWENPRGQQFHTSIEPGSRKVGDSLFYKQSKPRNDGTGYDTSFISNSPRK